MRAILCGIFLWTAASVFSLGAVSSETHASAGAFLKQCESDIKAWCKDKSGVGPVRECLKTHLKDLSPACRGHLGELKGKASTAGDACLADIRKHCKNAMPFDGGIQKCLKTNVGKLSSDCRDSLGKLGAR